MFCYNKCLAAAAFVVLLHDKSLIRSFLPKSNGIISRKYKRNVSPFFRTMLFSSSRKENKVEELSDEEVLLACNAYLQRKKKMKKTGDKFQERNEISSFDMDYFSIDKTQLEAYDYEDIESSQEEDLIEDNDTQEENDIDLIEDNEDEIQKRSASFERYSKASKARWSNEDFRSSWYKKRWGYSSPDPNRRKHAIIQSRLSKISSDVLNSPEFHNLNEEEVSYAVESYISSRTKQSQARELRKDRQKWFNETILPGYEKFQYSTSLEGMTKIRESRSERSRKAYQTRIANQRKVKQKAIVTPQIMSNTKVSSDIDRTKMSILVSLEHNRIPNVSDIEDLLKPKRCKGRREILVQILEDCFNLRGKCIPNPLKTHVGNSYDNLFTSSCKIEIMGNFVLQKVKESKLNLS